MSSITTLEFYGLIPLCALAVVYWFRDKLQYNRADRAWYRATRTQWTTLLCIYPLWIFTEWVNGIQLGRGDTTFVFLTTFGRALISYYSVVSILNDAYVFTWQQLLGFVLTLVISFAWVAFTVLVIGSSRQSSQSQQPPPPSSTPTAPPSATP